ncbi:hypothetical protein [Phocaeicola plebeius]|uniref:hypothetical protein n=1 Tax=Phocaeicola plebeius TaxID=310297 RepID=UPI0026EDFE0B|nr:hypothetical protein [Phocaeicola plebeius]
MKILIGFDILLSYLLNINYADGTNLLFSWINRIGAKKFTDAGSLMILTHFVSIDDFSRLQGFDIIKKNDIMHPEIKFLNNNISRFDINSKEDFRALLMQLNLLFTNKVDLLITENVKIHEFASTLNIEYKVYTIEEFIERCTIDYRHLDESKGIEIQEVKFGTLSLNDPFFKTFIDEYKPYYYEWFNKKKDDNVYVCKDKLGKIRALLKLKIEESNENYDNINPRFTPARRLKICSFKVDYTGQKIVQRFIRIIFDYSLLQKVDEIYVTIFNNSSQRCRLINIIESWGFYLHGTKNGKERVYVRKLNNELKGIPTYDYPFQSLYSPTYIIPIEESYSQVLLPSFEICRYPLDVEPYKSAIKKVITLPFKYEINNKNANLLFYKVSKDKENCGIIASGIFENCNNNFETKNSFVFNCKKRSIFPESILSDLWYLSDKHTIINFLYNYSFGKNIIRNNILDNAEIDIQHLLKGEPIMINSSQFKQIITDTIYEQNFIIYKA